MNRSGGVFTYPTHFSFQPVYLLIEECDIYNFTTCQTGDVVRQKKKGTALIFSWISIPMMAFSKDINTFSSVYQRCVLV